AIVVTPLCLAVSDKSPGSYEAFELPNEPIEREASEPEHEQPHDHHIAEQELRGVPDHPADARRRRDDLGRDQHGVGEAEADALAGADARQAGRKEDVAE